VIEDVGVTRPEAEGRKGHGVARSKPKARKSDRKLPQGHPLKCYAAAAVYGVGDLGCA
jgi:hypothetical protein